MFLSSRDTIRPNLSADVNPVHMDTYGAAARGVLRALRNAERRTSQLDCRLSAGGAPLAKVSALSGDRSRRHSTRRRGTLFKCHGATVTLALRKQTLLHRL